MLIVTAVLVILGALLYTLAVRTKDIPPPEPESPTKYLEERKATIYENLRDLQFEYRVGKLSDDDYQTTKADLQKELAVVMAEIDKLAGTAPAAASATAPAPKATAKAQEQPKAKPEPKPAKADTGVVCPHCSATMPGPMKFCGECGKPMTVEVR